MHHAKRYDVGQGGGYLFLYMEPNTNARNVSSKVQEEVRLVQRINST